MSPQKAMLVQKCLSVKAFPWHADRAELTSMVSLLKIGGR